MITESGAPNIPSTMVDSSRLYTRAWYPEYRQHFRDMLNSSLARPAKVELAAEWTKRDDGLITVKGNVKNLSGIELNYDNKARIQIVAYEDYENAFTHTTGRIGRGHHAIDISSLANGATQAFEMLFFMNAPVENWDNVHLVLLVDYKPAATLNGDYLPIYDGVYDQLNAIFIYPEGEKPVLEFKVDPTEFVGEIREDDLEMLNFTVSITGTPLQTWKATVDKDFVLLQPDNGPVNANMTVTFDKEKLVEGEQTATITIVDGAGQFEETVSVKITYILSDPEPEREMLYFPIVFRFEN